MALNITPMTEADAREIVGWRYDSPYDFYNPDPAAAAEDIACYVEPANRYFSVRDETGQLIASICFGEEARVAGGEYSADRLDIGCGMRPDLTGRGIGPSIIEAAIEFGQNMYGATRFRATIAAFNERALRATKKAGFEPVTTIQRPSDGRAFVILERGVIGRS